MLVPASQACMIWPPTLLSVTGLTQEDAEEAIEAATEPTSAFHKPISCIHPNVSSNSSNIIACLNLNLPVSAVLLISCRAARAVSPGALSQAPSPDPHVYC